MIHVQVRPEVLRWARERSGLEVAALLHRFPLLEDWEQERKQPTLKQLEGFATATHTPIGYLFLPEPPVERISIPDFRTVANERIDRPSPDLLDTLFLCQQRQEWYRDFARSVGESPVPFVGSARVTDDVVQTAARIGHSLGFSIEERRQLPTWTDALRRFIEQSDAVGVLVMVSGVVGSNNHRKLSPREFRGFALADDMAPLVFINGADTKAAQMFTLAHELAHVWLGQSALSDGEPASAPVHRVERWCDHVAAELLVPLDALRAEYDGRAPLRAETDRLARRFKVSTLVILRRIRDAGELTDDEYWPAYNAELERLRSVSKGSGGDFYLTLGVRAGKRFTRALVGSAMEGQSSFTEAFRLLGFSKMATFHELARNLGLEP